MLGLTSSVHQTPNVNTIPFKRLTLPFADAGVSAVLTLEAKPAHVVFELVDVQPTNRAELVLWGPYPTTIGDMIGEVVGVVRDPEFAVGIQELNAKTLGGYPTRENDIEADILPTPRSGSAPLWRSSKP